MSSEFAIGGRLIGERHPPFVIAEMSGNHNKSLDRALEIVEAAARCGAAAVKLQTYTPDTMTLDLDEGEFHIGDPNSLWTGTSLCKLYGEAHTPWEWHKPIYERARSLGIVAFSTPFDESAVDFLESLESPRLQDRLVREHRSAAHPPGGADRQAGHRLHGHGERRRAWRVRQRGAGGGCKNLILLKCTSTYPATPENTNIRTIPHLRELFGCEVGISDHTMGTGVSVASVALGATVIEKHFTLSRADGGVDSTFSMAPDEMRSLVVDSERAWQALGAVRMDRRRRKGSRWSTGVRCT